MLLSSRSRVRVTLLLLFDPTSKGTTIFPNTGDYVPVDTA
jgi:hypothetical protein